jgi:hypothetical protein
MLGALLAGATLLGGCGHIPMPFGQRQPPDLTPARASADNMVRLDAAMRSGCERVDNIEKPASPPAARSMDPQRWIAHTCTGDLSYDVVTTQGKDGPVVRVVPVKGPVNNPMNPNFKPAER